MLFYVLKCYNCSIYLVQQHTKNHKFECRRCGSKQSIQHKYYEAEDSKLCRQICMELNMKQGERNEQKILRPRNDFPNQYQNNDTNMLTIVNTNEAPILSTSSLTNQVNNNNHHHIPSTISLSSLHNAIEPVKMTVPISYNSLPSVNTNVTTLPSTTTTFPSSVPLSSVPNNHNSLFLSSSTTPTGSNTSLSIPSSDNINMKRQRENDPLSLYSSSSSTSSTFSSLPVSTVNTNNHTHKYPRLYNETLLDPIINHEPKIVSLPINNNKDTTTLSNIDKLVSTPTTLPNTSNNNNLDNGINLWNEFL